MAQLPYFAAYAGLAVFVVAVVARFLKWSKMPMHMRWELYPVAHEAGKAQYGGSYLEEPEWWTKDREVSMAGELKAMVPEILFLVALREHNRKMWVRSFPFHFGMYLAIGATALLFVLGAVGAGAPEALAGGTGELVRTVVVVLGVAGLALGLIGALALLHRRLTAPELKDFTTSADLFNLAFFVVAFGCALATFFLADPSGAAAARFAQNLVTLNLQPLAGTGLAVQLPFASVVLLSLLTAYVPLTHMSHFVGKYFAYHAIRWNDAPNLAGGDQEATIQELLNRPVSWAAAHIGGDGKKTWAEVATVNPFTDKKQKGPKNKKSSKDEEKDA